MTEKATAIILRILLRRKK